MAAGGTFTVQNKVRPGIYFRFRSKNKQDLTVGDRGIAALCEPLHHRHTDSKNNTCNTRKGKRDIECI